MGKKVVGIVGLGLMGHGMALNLLKNGIGVLGADIREDACQRVRELGGEIAENAVDVGRRCKHIIVSMSVTEAYYSVIEDLKNNCAPGTIVMETSTLSIKDKEFGRDELGQKDIIMLDTTLSGNSTSALKGNVVAMLSGDEKSKKEVIYVFEGFCKEWHDLGEFGNSTKMKLVANHQTCVHAAGVAECLFFASKLGLDLDQVIKVLSNGAGSCGALGVHGPLIAKREWEKTTNRVMKHFKDQRITCELMGDIDCPVPLYKTAVLLHKRTAELGHEDHDRAAIYEVLERMDKEHFELKGLDVHVDKDTI